MPIQSSNPPEVVALGEWAGVNQQTKSRSSIGDQEVFWAENFFPTAEGQLRTAWGPSAPIYTTPGGAIRRMFFGRVNDTIGASALIFRADGVVDQVQLSTGIVRSIGSIWSPATPESFADAKVWSPQQVGYTAGTPGGWVIGSPLGLFAWDGINLSAPGDTAPTWLTGGATTTMPSGLPGIWGLEVYGGRLWVMGKTVISFSAPGNGADFSSVNGGGSFGYQGDLLAVSWTHLQQAAGFLYLYGDSSINVISYLQMTGSGTDSNPYVTTFLNSNIDPMMGHAFHRPVAVWGPMFMSWTNEGIQALQGNANQKISGKLDQLFGTVNVVGATPSFAIAHIFGQRWLLCHGLFTDPWGSNRSLMLCFNGKQWTLASQRHPLIDIGYYEENSTLTPYGTDASSLYQLFAQPDPQLRKELLTKQYKGKSPLSLKNWKRVYAELRDYSNLGASLSAIVKSGGGDVPGGEKHLSFDLPPGGYDIIGYGIEGGGIWTMLDMRSFSSDFAVESLMLSYEDRVALGA